MYICVYILISIYMFICIHVYICICVYINIYNYKYIYMHMGVKGQPQMSFLRLLGLFSGTWGSLIRFLD